MTEAPLISNYFKCKQITLSNLKRLTEWIKTQEPSTCCQHETYFKAKDTNRLKVKEWKKIFYANSNQKGAGVAILMSDKIDFKSKKFTIGKEGHYILIRGSRKK